MNLKKIFPIITLLIFTGLFAAGKDPFCKVKVGEQAPDFKIVLQDGTVKKLSDLKGKIVWINFFANWCGPCRAELPHLEKEIYQQYKDRNDFEVLVIGREHNWATVNKFKTENKYTLPFYPDPKKEVYTKFAQKVIPRNFIIDKTGKIAVASLGYTEKEFGKLTEELKQLLQ